MKRIVCGVSGGRSSGMLAKILRDERDSDPDLDVRFVFNNTGQEDDRTLVFVDRLDREWGLGVTWLEPVVDPRPMKGTRHKAVSFSTASRDGQPFVDVVAKYGLPNKSYPHCNRELKLAPTKSFVENELGWEQGSYDTALGIRADEADRISVRAKENRLIYPLVKRFIQKSDVYRFWKDQAFDLYVPEHLGNCRWCWKKSQRKHLTLAVDYPEVFDFPRMLEDRYSSVKADERGEQKMFRNHQSVADIFEAAKHPFEKFRDGREAFDPELDASGGACGEESCEMWADGDLFYDGGS